MNLNCCRICLKRDIEIYPIFSRENGPRISDLFQFCFQSLIHEKDKLPQLICLTCMVKLGTAHEIKTEFIKNDKYLRSILLSPPVEPMIIKEEPLDIPPDFEELIIIENLKSEISFEETEPDKEECEKDESIKEESDKEATSSPKSIPKKPRPKKSFDCYICDEKFSLKSDKIIHIKNVHNQEKFKYCSICAFVGTCARYLDCHMKNHKLPKNFLCQHCSAKFFDSTALSTHIRKVHRAELNSQFYVCDFCPKRFKSKRSIYNHIQGHRPEKRYNCELCNAGYSAEEPLQVHMFRQHGFEAKIQCTICKNPFTTMFRLKRHRERYKGECVEKFKSNPFPFEKRKKNAGTFHTCEFCSKVYTNKYQYETHINAHTNKRPFKCPKCQKGFFSKVAVKVHTPGCENLLLFKCDLCEKAFNIKPSLELHIRRHKGETPFSCESCPMKFASRKMFLRHMKIVHNIRNKTERILIEKK